MTSTKVFSLFRYKRTHSLSTLSPLPHWTGQLDGLLGTMERLYKEVGFEVCFQGSKRRRLTDCRRKRVPDGRGLTAENAMSKCLEVLPKNFKPFFMTRSQWTTGLVNDKKKGRVVHNRQSDDKQVLQVCKQFVQGWVANVAVVKRGSSLFSPLSINLAPLFWVLCRRLISIAGKP